MTVFFAIGFFQGIFDEVLRHYAIDKHKLFDWKIKNVVARWAIYLTGTGFIFALPFTWLAAMKIGPEWSFFYTPVWFAGVMVGMVICKRLLATPA